MDHEAATAHVRKAFAEAGVGSPANFSPSELLDEKVDTDRDPCYVLGACNPGMADWALDASENRSAACSPATP